MANEKSLKKFGKDKPPLSHEEAVKNGKKGAEKSIEVRKEKKEEAKENKRFADIFNIILETETKDEKIKQKIKENYPTLKPNKKNLVAMEHFARMFKKTISKTKDGVIIAKKMSDKDFLNFEEYMRNSIGEKPIDKVQQTTTNIEIKDKNIIKEIVDKIKNL